MISDKPKGLALLLGPAKDEKPKSDCHPAIEKMAKALAPKMLAAMKDEDEAAMAKALTQAMECARLCASEDDESEDDEPEDTEDDDEE